MDGLSRFHEQDALADWERRMEALPPVTIYPEAIDRLFKVNGPFTAIQLLETMGSIELHREVA